eukprot:TRINITY_DN7662_c0_g1_i1.p1 TRINITY_DN7662_c0_g1~~TRINITY_DN7662_c0_g1_i1.p1  ORF type:complete len:351 (+),score=66.06 TRINITY_DN7662_c0_g1_i1:42-1094(+)
MGFGKFIRLSIFSTGLITLVPVLLLFCAYFAPQKPIPETHWATTPQVSHEGLSFERVTTKQNIGLSVVTSGEKEGELIIFLHGFPETALLSWHNQLRFFGNITNNENGPHQFFAVAPDLRGYNHSDKPVGSVNYNLDLLAQDVTDLIEYYGRKNAIIVGHDWGAFIGWWVAINHPDRVKKLAIINVPHPTAFEDILLNRPKFSQLIKSGYILFFQAPFVPEWTLAKNDFERLAVGLVTTARPGTFAKEDIDLYKQAWGVPGALESAINYYREGARSKFRSGFAKATKTRVVSKTLILWGKDDAFLESELAESSAPFCDDAEVHYIDATHWILHEQPDKVNQYLLNFISQP